MTLLEASGELDLVTALDDRPPHALRLASWPGSWKTNPYVDLFHRGLAEHGIEFWGPAEVNDGWLRRHANSVDVVHFHWPERIWRHVGSGPWQQLRAIAGLWSYLRLARRLGVISMWTVHNLEPHDGATLADRMGYRMLAAACNLVVCHSQSSAAELPRTRRAPVVMPHGTYAGYFPAPRARVEVLRQLGLNPGLPTVSCVGHLRAYKGIDTACQAVAGLACDEAVPMRPIGTHSRPSETGPPPKVQLIIAGEPFADVPRESVERMLAKIPGAVGIYRRIDDQEYTDIVSASDAVLLPYRRITGSGALLSALTSGNGIVATDLPYFREILDGEPDAFRLAPPENSASLSAAIRMLLEVPEPRRAAAISRLQARYSWSRVAAPLAQAIVELSRQMRPAASMPTSAVASA